MARKRITEEDLLGFRREADKLAEEVAVKYEALDKARKPVEDVVVRDLGILILYSEDADRDAVLKFAANAKGKGYAVETAELKKNPAAANGSLKKIPEWQEVMDKAQMSYLMLCEHSERVAVMGTGCAVPTATLIAEQYPVEALILVGQGLSVRPFTTKRTAAKLSGVAKHNLFSVVCPVYCLAPETDNVFKNDCGKLFRECSRSDDIREEVFAGKTLAGMWTECEHELETRIFDYLTDL